MQKNMLTTVVHDDYHPYFWGGGIQTYPLTLLNDTPLNSVALENDLLLHLPADVFRIPRRLDESGRIIDWTVWRLLDVVVSFLLPWPNDVVSDWHLRRVTEGDYSIETSWVKYTCPQSGYEWLHNAQTNERFWIDRPGNWIAYRIGHRIWWLNGKRWFWAP